MRDKYEHLETPADYFGKTIHYPICQCGEVIRNDDPCEYKGEPICDPCMSDVTAFESGLYIIDLND